ncbi:NAD(P)H-hydrate dehydratase, partial [Curvivirga aplysinae]|uniref:NAD(P)H-hydrate dehydratase n=1 Tax=Curvivirga aplysinae TaxID=2529852 RepID=UPI0012BBBF4B
MKHNLLSVEEMRKTDQVEIETGTDSLWLMENAGIEVVKHIRRTFSKGNVLILCGPGNNGGDGFVIARHLQEMGWDVQVVLFGDSKRMSQDALVMADRWAGELLAPESALLSDLTLVVDAVFGTGLDRSLEPELIEFLDSLEDLPIVSVDIPTGVNGDTGLVLGQARQAHSTVTFCRKKTGHLLYPGRALAGELILADIGIKDENIQVDQLSCIENHEGLWSDVFHPPKHDAHKFSRGYAIVAGAEVMTGATRLAARAAQRIGAGYVVIASPEKASTLYRVSLSSVIVRGYRDTTGYKEILRDQRADAYLIGPGMGYAFGAQERVLTTMKEGKPTVLDADALSMFSENQDLLFDSIKGPCIMTPHEGEFAKLFPEILSRPIGKLEQARLAAKSSGAVIVFKGADTVIADPSGQAIINSNAPSDLATAGSGDVLAGMITGLLAQGNQAFSSAAAAVWLHGELGNFCGQGLIAEDLVDAIP